MSYMEQGMRGHQYKVQAYQILEQCRALQPGAAREKMEQEAWNLHEEGERLLNLYRTSCKRVYGSR